LPAEKPRGDGETNESGKSSLPAAVAIVFLVFLAYFPVFSAGFIWDDDDHVTNNETLRSAEGLREIWFVPRSLPQYYPLVHTSFWIEYHLWGLAPLGYHVTNVLLHATSAVLLWRLLVALQVRGAWLAAALFAVHPVTVESVAWVTERKNVLSLALALGSLIAYFRFAPADDAASNAKEAHSVAPGRWSWYALALFLFTGALLSKTVVATLPAVILVIVWWKRGRLQWRDVRPLVPFFVLGIGTGLTTAWLERHHVGAMGDEWSLSPMDRVLLAGRVVWFYAGKLAWAYPLTFIYPRFTINARELWQYLFPLAAILVLVPLWLARKQIGRGPLAAVLIFVGVLFPALGFFDVYPFRYSFVADHFQYHASIALFALAMGCIASYLQRQSISVQKLTGNVLGVLLVFLMVLTARQTRVYHDLETLYRDTIAKNPTGWLAPMNLATHLEGLERYDEALALERDAVELNPNEPGIRANLGATLLKTGELTGFQPGQLEEIVAELNQALALGATRPGLARIEPAIHNNLATAIVKLGQRDGFQPGQLESAIAHLQEALRLSPDFVGAHNNLASTLILVGQAPAAIEHLSRSLELEPENPDTLASMGSVLAAEGRAADAQTYFARALAIKPENAAANYGLALLLISENKSDDALQHLDRARAADPRLAEVYYATAGIFAAREQWQQAADEYMAAVQLRPGYDRAWNNLGVIMIKLGQIDRAIESFQNAVRVNPNYAEATANLEGARQVKEQSNSVSPSSSKSNDQRPRDEQSPAKTP
jgi:tetratricopeptide (TPR) repeat protein